MKLVKIERSVKVDAAAVALVEDFICKLQDAKRRMAQPLPPLLRLDVGNGGVYEVESQASIVYVLSVLEIEGEFLSALRTLCREGYIQTLLRVIETPAEEQFYVAAARRIGCRASFFKARGEYATSLAWLSGATPHQYAAAVRQGWNPVSQPSDRERWMPFTGGWVVREVESLAALLEKERAGLCIKPVQGMCSRSVEVFARGKFSGSSTRSRVLRRAAELIAQEGAVFAQRFIPPFIRDGWYGIWRVYIALHAREPVPVLWVYNERKSTFRIHGASDARFYLGEVG